MTERLISGASVWAPFIVYVYTALQLLLLWVRYRSQKKQGNLLDMKAVRAILLMHQATTLTAIIVTLGTEGLTVYGILVPSTLWDVFWVAVAQLVVILTSRWQVFYLLGTWKARKQHNREQKEQFDE